MEQVTLVYVTDSEHGKQLIGIAGSVDKAIKLLRKSGYASILSEEQFTFLALFEQEVNGLKFKLETWEVHQAYDVADKNENINLFSIPAVLDTLDLLNRYKNLNKFSLGQVYWFESTAGYRALFYFLNIL